MSTWQLIWRKTCPGWQAGDPNCQSGWLVRRSVTGRALRPAWGVALRAAWRRWCNGPGDLRHD
jgi:hypothetical protein